MAHFFSFSDIQQALKTKSVTCLDITKNYLQRISKNHHLNVFVEVFEDEALAKAKKIDEKLKNGEAGKLAGMVVGIKDNICFKGHEVTASSKILCGFESLYSATAVKKLIEEDAIIIGRLNCDEFAMGSANENSCYGPVKNPIDNQRVAGGSSGGSAAAVAAGLCLAALGSDTGGSIRQPASFCGVVGVKPTYSRVSRHGLIAYASSFDQIGPIANNVEDAALVLEVISGKDQYDSTATRRDMVLENLNILNDKPQRIAYIKECLEHKLIDPEIRRFLQKKVTELKEKGHTVEPINFPYLDLLVPTYYVISTAEASSNLARYDGVHFGYRGKSIEDLETTYINSRTEGFGEEVKRRIMLGTFVLSAGYHEEFFVKAQKIRRLIQDKTRKMFDTYDFIISPTTPRPPFKLGEEQKDPTVIYLEDIFTVQANLSGNPAISLPLGKHKNGLPIGLHVMADDFKETEMLAFAKSISK